MNARGRIIAMIPARLGSTRLAMKNLALVNGKPLIYYAVRAAKGSGVFDRVVINSEDAVFEKIALRYDVEFYQRPAEWATSTAKSDCVVYDFLKHNRCDIVAWVNPTSPLQTAQEVRGVVRYFMKNRLDSLITVKDEQVHCVYKGRPVNFNFDEIFAQTQELAPVESFVYSVMMWRTEAFMRSFEEKGHAFFSGRVGFYPVSKLSSVIIKREEDLMLADSILRTLKSGRGRTVRYDAVVRKKKGRAGT